MKFSFRCDQGYNDELGLVCGGPLRIWETGVVSKSVASNLGCCDSIVCRQPDCRPLVAYLYLHVAGSLW